MSRGSDNRSEQGFSDMESYKSESLNDRSHGGSRPGSSYSKTIEGAADYFAAGTNDFNFQFSDSMNRKMEKDAFEGF